MCRYRVCNESLIKPQMHSFLYHNSTYCIDNGLDEAGKVENVYMKGSFNDKYVHSGC